VDPTKRADAYCDLEQLAIVGQLLMVRVSPTVLTEPLTLVDNDLNCFDRGF
jgi:hypothetical protein